MNDAVHVEVEIVELDLVRVRRRRVDGGADAVDLGRLRKVKRIVSKV